MARNRRGKKALYEVMSKVRFKSDYGKTLEKLHPEKRESEQESPSLSGEVMRDKPVQWWRKPRAVQLNMGRVEFSLSYPVAGVVVLGIIVIILLAFRAGQYYSFSGSQASDNPKSEISEAVGGLKTEGKQSSDVSPTTTNIEPAKSKGDNTIVLVEYPRRADLVPVQKHFAEYGIETEIVNWSGRYFLITKDRFSGFGPGSDGYVARQKIVEVGALYKGKAPEGYESFAPHFFKDAYGKKIE